MHLVPCFRVALLLILAATTIAPASAQQAAAAHEPREVAAILEMLDRYMIAISNNDLGELEKMQTPDGMTYRASRDTAGAWTIRSRSNLQWVAPSNASEQAYRERYWQPTVLVRGPIAVVWTPYEFWIDGRTNHCGVDVFNLVKVDGTWRVANSMWTVEPDACAELRPRDPAEVRPRG